MRTTAIKKTASRYISIMLAFVFALTLVLSFERGRANAVTFGGDGTAPTIAGTMYSLIYSTRECIGTGCATADSSSGLGTLGTPIGASGAPEYYISTAARDAAIKSLPGYAQIGVAVSTIHCDKTTNKHTVRRWVTANVTANVAITTVFPVGTQVSVQPSKTLADATVGRIVAGTGGGNVYTVASGGGGSSGGSGTGGISNPGGGTVYRNIVNGYYYTTTHCSYDSLYDFRPHSYNASGVCVYCAYVRNTTTTATSQYERDATRHRSIDANGNVGAWVNHTWSTTNTSTRYCTVCHYGYFSRYETNANQHRWINENGVAGSWVNHTWSTANYGILGYTSARWCTVCNYGNYGYGYGYGYDDYSYALWLAQQNTNQTTTTTTTTPTATVDMRVTVGGRTYSGPSGLINAMNANKGATLNVNMGEQTSIPASVLTAARTNGCTLQIAMRNGALWVINGSDITAARTINLGITYNTRNIPSAAARRVSSGALSMSQLTIGDNVALGSTVTVGVKYNASRAGRTATLYRYDTARGALVQVSRATINSTGHVRFTGVNRGGDYLTVISR